MYKRNEGIDESSIIQNKFTSYLVLAVRGRKNDYLESKIKIQQCERSLDEMSKNNIEAFIIEPDMSLELPLLEQIENVKLHKALKKAKIKDLYILFAKVLEDRSFVEIGAELGIKPNTAAVIYYRFIKRLQNELGGGNPNEF